MRARNRRIRRNRHGPTSQTDINLVSPISGDQTMPENENQNTRNTRRRGPATTVVSQQLPPRQDVVVLDDTLPDLDSATRVGNPTRAGNTSTMNSTGDLIDLTNDHDDEVVLTIPIDLSNGGSLYNSNEPIDLRSPARQRGDNAAVVNGQYTLQQSVCE